MCLEVCHLELGPSGRNKEVAACTLHVYTFDCTEHLLTWKHDTQLSHGLCTIHKYLNSPLGEGRHLEHLPQLHLDPLGTWERLFRVDRLVSLVAPLPLLEREEPPGLAWMRASMASFTVFDSIRLNNCWIYWKTWHYHYQNDVLIVHHNSTAHANVDCKRFDTICTAYVWV